MTDLIPDFKPMMLCGLTWQQVQNQLRAVDCAARRPHWCSPVVILQGGDPVIDDDGDILPLQLRADDRRADDWMLVRRVGDDGNEVEPSYRCPPCRSTGWDQERRDLTVCTSCKGRRTPTPSTLTEHPGAKQ